MQNELQVGFVVENLMEFQRTCPHGLVGFSHQGSGLHLGDAQDIEAAIDDVGAFQARVHLDDLHRELGEDRVDGIDEHRGLVLRKDKLRIR